MGDARNQENVNDEESSQSGMQTAQSSISHRPHCHKHHCFCCACNKNLRDRFSHHVGSHFLNVGKNQFIYEPNQQNRVEIF
jgi:hypothetical protein